MVEGRNIIRRRLTTEIRELRLATWVSFAAAVVVLPVGWMMAALITEGRGELVFLGMVGVTCVSLLLAVLGGLCDLERTIVESRGGSRIPLQRTVSGCR
jgi:hypothetical protein